MLKTTIERNDRVDVNYSKLNSLLKDSSVGFIAKKSNVFQPEQIRRFLVEAPDSDFLIVKVRMCFIGSVTMFLLSL